MLFWEKTGQRGQRNDLCIGKPHLQRLEQWVQKGKVILAGPLTDKTGSLIVVETESLEEAQDFAQNDPYMLNGVFQEVSVHPFMQVFPRETEVEKT